MSWQVAYALIFTVSCLVLMFPASAPAPLYVAAGMFALAIPSGTIALLVT